MSGLIERVSTAIASLLVGAVFLAARMSERDVTWFANVTDES